MPEIESITTSTTDTPEVNTTPQQALEPSLGIKSQTEQIAELQTEIELLRLQAAVASVTKHKTDPLGTGHQDVKREQAIRAAGGQAMWFSMTPEQRAAVMGVAENISSDEVKKYFGRGSDGMAAQNLAKTNPARYRALRVVAKERGIF